MNWTSIYLNSENLNVFILGTGEVATRRAKRFLNKGANVILAGDTLPNEIKNNATLVSTNNIETHVKWADLVIIASGDKELSNYTAKIAKNKLINRADMPEEGNIIVPTSFSIDDVEISIFTNGKSPLMARKLRKKIQSIITEEDIITIKMQDYARKLLKEKIENQKIRKEILYALVKENKTFNDFELAKIYIEDFINDY